jgi:hypothetical protein
VVETLVAEAVAPDTQALTMSCVDEDAELLEELVERVERVTVERAARLLALEEWNIRELAEANPSIRLGTDLVEEVDARLRGVESNDQVLTWDP